MRQITANDGMVHSPRGILDEEASSLVQAARRLPQIRRHKTPHPATLFRWATAGRKSRSGLIVRLEIWKVGGTNCTSKEALTRFLDRLNDTEPVDPPRTLKQAAFDKQAEVAKEILRERGII
jgi:hypothetical protein